MSCHLVLDEEFHSFCSKKQVYKTSLTSLLFVGCRWIPPAGRILSISTQHFSSLNSAQKSRTCKSQTLMITTRKQFSTSAQVAYFYAFLCSTAHCGDAKDCGPMSRDRPHLVQVLGSLYLHDRLVEGSQQSTSIL
jgi:hypothetical protein